MRLTERIIRGVIAIIIAAFAGTMTATAPAVAAVAAGASIIIGFMATTGWCPASLLRQRPARGEVEASPLEDYEDARELVDIDALTRKKESIP